MGCSPVSGLTRSLQPFPSPPTYQDKGPLLITLCCSPPRHCVNPSSFRRVSLRSLREPVAVSFPTSPHHHFLLNMPAFFLTDDHVNLTCDHFFLTSLYVNVTSHHFSLTPHHFFLTGDHFSLTSLYVNVTDDHYSLTSLYVNVTDDHYSLTCDHVNVTSHHFSLHARYQLPKDLIRTCTTALLTTPRRTITTTTTTTLRGWNSPGIVS